MGMRPSLSHARLLLAGAACVVTLAACGSTAASSASLSGTHSAAHPKVALDIKVTSPGGETRHWTLTCDPAGGTHPSPAAACRTLMHARQPFARPGKGMMCPMIVAGTTTATIQGRWFGHRVNSKFVDGGCEIVHWKELGKIFS
jgi:hypothetical protein